MRITSQTAEQLIRRWGGLVSTQEKKKSLKEPTAFWPMGDPQCPHKKKKS